MKKTILFAVMMMAISTSYAQLRVDSLGNIQMGTLSPYNSRLTISGTQNGIYCETTPTATKRNANIKPEPGSTLILNDGGRIITHAKDEFSVPVGAHLEINEGSVE